MISTIFAADALLDGALAIDGASAGIAAGNLDLSHRTERQAGALEETAASMEALTAAVRQNSASADQANCLARSASTVALSGGRAVAQMASKMEAINDFGTSAKHYQAQDSERNWIVRPFCIGIMTGALFTGRQRSPPRLP